MWDCMAFVTQLTIFAFKANSVSLVLDNKFQIIQQPLVWIDRLFLCTSMAPTTDIDVLQPRSNKSNFSIRHDMFRNAKHAAS
mmetsp:Transcript_10065/g.22901  ORF Transcript_10065/g.22901 Transcript_10065/m.22901 type:complete len:82 (+) Transcript_10065:1827-2072(+)